MVFCCNICTLSHQRSASTAKRDARRRRHSHTPSASFDVTRASHRCPRTFLPPPIFTHIMTLTNARNSGSQNLAPRAAESNLIFSSSMNTFCRAGMNRSCSLQMNRTCSLQWSFRIVSEAGGQVLWWLSRVGTVLLFPVLQFRGTWTVNESLTRPP